MRKGWALLSTGAVLAALTTGLFAGQAQAPATAQQPPIFRSGVTNVRVDATVTDRNGTPLTDLKEEDFEITEGGKRQKITSFNLMMLDGGLMPGPEGAPASISSDAVEVTEAARDDVRLFTIFLDDYHVSHQASRIVREQVSRFVETQLGPSDMVGVMYPLTSVNSIRMTRNHASVVKLLQQFEGRSGDYKPMNAIEEGYVYKNLPATIEEIRAQVVQTALEGLAMHMGGMKEGRQAVILVSEGFRGGGLNVYSQLQFLADTANRYHTAFYPVSPMVLPPPTQWMPNNPMETLTFLATHTGGRAIFDQTKTSAEYRERMAVPELPISKLTLAMKQVMIDASVFYLMAYNSTTTGDDKYHKIDVKVKRRGAEVRAREGYWAWKTPPSELGRPR